MSRKQNTHGGGSKTTKLGKIYEKKFSLKKILEAKYDAEQIKYQKKKEELYYLRIKENNKIIGYLTNQNYFNKHYLNLDDSSYRKILPKKLQPDEVFINELNKTIYILEKKRQGGGGSVDEKLTTSDFKIKQYKKLINKTKNGYKVKLIYILDSFFNVPLYEDHLNYIKDSGCEYSFSKIELSKIGL